uniref:General substrate transporter n=1 Tax=Mycena chlorophos TaxID=658473 RepID=A0ABQ0LAB6_MYCCL|nr:general substrate transporter [Mycena chlorophos]
MASLGDALFGYSHGATAAFQVQPNFISRMYAHGKSVSTENVQLREVEVSPMLPAMFVSPLNVTALLGALGAPYLDPLGRRTSIRIGALFYLVASFIQMFSFNFPMLAVEIASANARGMFVSLETFWMNAGYCGPSWIGHAFYFDMRGEESWRGPYGIQALISLILFVWTFYLPETPRWLIQNGFKSEGLWTLAELHAAGDITDDGITRTYFEIEDTVELKARDGARGRWKDLFTQYTRRTVIAWLAQMLAQLNGINALLHFLPETLAHAGMKVSQALFWSSVCSVFYLVGTIPAILYLDKLGRRIFLLCGSVALAVSLVTVGAIKLCLERWPDKLSTFMGARGIVILTSFYLFFFASPCGPIPWLLGAELFPLKVRSKGMAVSTISDWLFEFVVAFAAPSMFETLRAGAYFLMAGFCIISWIVVWLVFVETGMTTLEEVGTVFGDEMVKPRRSAVDEDQAQVTVKLEREDWDLTSMAGDNYSREALRERTIPFMTLSTAENPLTAPITRRNDPALSDFTPAEVATRRFAVSGNAIVTGGAGMLALEVVRALLEHGASGVALFDLAASFASAHAQTAIPALRQDFPDRKILEKVVDATDEDGVARGVAESVEEFGESGVQILLCFAGVVSTVHAEEMTGAQFRRVVEINTTGSWICAQAVGKQMIAQKTGGSIVFTASISGHSVNFPQPQVAYNVSKGALLQLRASLAAEWARYGIRVNSISPGYCDTILNEGDGLAEAREIWASRNPMGRMADPSELSGVVVMLCSPAGRYVNGADIIVDGGGSLSTAAWSAKSRDAANMYKGAFTSRILEQPSMVSGSGGSIVHIKLSKNATIALVVSLVGGAFFAVGLYAILRRWMNSRRDAQRRAAGAAPT